MTAFTVTESAMRPACPAARECFYCREPIGSTHKPDCVLVKKRVKVRVTIEYEVAVPASWDAEDIEFHRNESSWCASNLLTELEGLETDETCLCQYDAHFTYLGGDSEPFLKE